MFASVRFIISFDSSCEQMYITPNTASSRKYRLFQEGERARLKLPSSCIERTFWFSSHGDGAGIYAICEQTNPRWCTMMCKIEPVYKVVKSRKMRSLTTRVDFIFGFCIKSWSRTHSISGIDHHWVMLSCYRDDSCRVGASFVRDRVSVFVARPAGRTFFRNGDTPINGQPASCSISRPNFKLKASGPKKSQTPT